MTLCISASTFASPVTIDGTLLERGTRKPLGGVNVYLLPLALKATTDEGGRFQLEEVPAGQSYRWVTQQPDYLKLDQDYELSKNATSPQTVTLFLERTGYAGFETVIRDRSDQRDPTVRTLTKREIETLAGAQGDPIRAVQNLPGVNRSQGDSTVIIQGSAPGDTGFFVDSIDVPLSFHLWGNTSILHPEALDHLDYFSAGFGPDYGGSTAGIVGLWTRGPKRDRWHAFASVDIYNASALLETPLDDRSGLLISARKSYARYVLAPVASRYSYFDLTPVPDFWDTTAIYERELTPIDQLKVVALASHDELSYLGNEPVDPANRKRGTYSFDVGFYRLIPQLTHRHSGSTTSRFALGLGWEKLSEDRHDRVSSSRDLSLQPRYELTRRNSDSWTMMIGAEEKYLNTDAKIGSRSMASGGGETTTLDQVPGHAPGFFMRNLIRRPGSPWLLAPGIRVDYFSPAHDWMLQPRGAIRYSWSERTSARVAGGFYAQPPTPSQSRVEPTLKSGRALHLAAAVDHQFSGAALEGLSILAGPYYKFLSDLPNFSSAADHYYDNSGRGRAYGWETLLKLEHRWWKGWLAYTLARSVRWDSVSPTHPVDFDQTHNVNLVSTFFLPRNWVISTRLRYVTGNTYTPFIGGILHADRQAFSPIEGPENSERYADYLQWDIRVEKRWITDRWILSAYLDVLNVTNRNNPSHIVRAEDYSQIAFGNGLPILPTFGLKAEY